MKNFLTHFKMGLPSGQKYCERELQESDTVSDRKIGHWFFNAPCTRWAKFMCGLYVFESVQYAQ